MALYFLYVIQYHPLSVDYNNRANNDRDNNIDE